MNSATNGTNTNPKLPSKNILLVEDNPADIRLIKEVLKEEKTKNNLNTVFDGTDAIEYLHGHCEPIDSYCPNLIILDLNLPKMSGFEVLEEIKNDNKLHEIPVVVFTTSSNREDGLKCYNMDAYAYIPKPVDYEGFVQVIKKINKLLE